MAILDITVPQMGEGLQEVIIVGFQKQPGDHVKRDELLYSMETDKAVMEVESPYEGVLKEWLAAEGDVLPIGAAVARIEMEDAVVEATTPGASAVTGGLPLTRSGEAETAAETVAVIPPRTRAYCRTVGISDEEMRRIPAPTGKLMPADVDAYLKAKANGMQPAASETEVEETLPYIERPLSQQHRVFIYRLKRSAQIVVPGTAKRPMEWGNIRRHAEGYRNRGGSVQPSTFQTFAYCVVEAVKEHPRFRSALIGETLVREYNHLNVGIAVGRPNGELVTAVVEEADTLDFPAFVTKTQEQIAKAREGDDQASESTQLLLTYMGPYEIVDAVPVLVAPAVAILFIGAAFEQNGETLVNLVLTFDHRLIQGIEAAEFLKTIVAKAKQVAELAA